MAQNGQKRPFLAVFRHFDPLNDSLVKIWPLQRVGRLKKHKKCPDSEQKKNRTKRQVSKKKRGQNDINSKSKKRHRPCCVPFRVKHGEEQELVKSFSDGKGGRTILKGGVGAGHPKNSWSMVKPGGWAKENVNVVLSCFFF